MRLTAIGKSFPDPMKHFFRAADPLDVFAWDLERAINEHIFPHVQCRICFEPGRWICHDAMHLVMTVIDKKAQDLVITDAGTNAVGWERFESDYFPVLNLTRPSLKEITCDVLGSLCTPHDVWGNACWGEGIEPGDVLMIPTQGAYTYSLRQHFIKPLPSVVTIALQ
jgi:diaminopimelate decarboxylase